MFHKQGDSTMQSFSTVAVGALTSIALASSGIVSPSSQASDSPIDIANFLADVRPTVVSNVDLDAGADGFRTTGSGEAVIPRGSDGSVEIRSSLPEGLRLGGFPGERALVTAGDDSAGVLSVQLPGQGGQGSLAADGTVVYPEESGVTLAVQAGDDEVRVHAVLDSAESADGLTYRFDDLIPELNDDGSVTLFAENAGVQLSVGYIHAPWASDANGVPVETAYEIEGNAVTQTIVVRGDTVFPVAADPQLQADCGIVTCTVRLDRATTKSWSNYGGDVGKMVASLAALGAAFGGAVGIAVSGAAAVIIGVRFDVFSRQAADYYSNGNCFGIKFPAVNYGAGWGTQVTRGTFNCN